MDAHVAAGEKGIQNRKICLIMWADSLIIGLQDQLRRVHVGYAKHMDYADYADCIISL